MTPAIKLVCRLSPRLVALSLATGLTVLLPDRAVASEHAAAKPAGVHEKDGHEKSDDKEGGHEADADKPLRTDVFELGEFKIRNTLPTHHVTVQIQFSVSLILSSTTTLADVHALQKWQQRVRDQAIIAVRSADPADFADPQLRRLRRLIMLRLHRLHTPAKIIGVYLTDFAVDKAD